MPPLEDMTSLVERVKEKHKSTPKSVDKSAPTREIPETSTKQTAEKVAATKKSAVGYGGMKKGFLFGNNTATKPTKSAKKSPSTEYKVDYEVKASSEAKSLVFDEVQEAVKDNVGFPKGSEWVTDDLLKKVEGNEALLKKLSDPKFAQALQWMQKDPHAAKEYYKNDKDVQDFFMEFYQLLGQHFTALGEQTNKSSANAAPHVKSDDEIKFEEIISKPEIKAILEKPNIKHLFKVLRSDPEGGQRLFHSSSAELKADVQKLTEAGLLNFESRPGRST